MKKIFTLLTALFAVMAVNAQTWDITAWETADVTTTTTIDGLTYYGEAKSAYAAGKKTFEDSKEWAGRIKMGGSSTFKADAMSRAFSFEGKKGCTVKVYAVHGSSSGDDRNVYVSQNPTDTKNDVANTFGKVATVAGAESPKVLTATIPADGTVYVWADNNVGVHAIVMEEAGGGDPTPGETVSDVISSSVQEVFDVILASINNPTTNSNPNFVLVPQDKKIYPEGTYPDKADDVKLEDGQNISLNDYIWEITKGNMKIKGVSTLNADGSANEAWQKKFNANKLEVLSEVDTLYYMPKTGNPSIAYKDFYDYNGDGDPVHRVVDQMWTPGCGKLPAKGCYYKITSAVDGKIRFGFRLSNNLNQKNFYIVDSSTESEGYKTINSADLKIKGYRQNKNYEFEKGNTSAAGEFLDVTLTENYLLTHENWGSDTNRQFFGYATWTAKAGVDYYVFSPNCQLGFFSVGIITTTGISDIVVEKAQNDAIYNIAGQRVSGSAKGLVIKNGKKYFVK